MDLRAYIEERSIPEPNTGCWIWMRGVGSHGYGSAKAPHHTAHRASFVAFNGPIALGMLVQHSCDNHWCVAPHHLSLGTDKTNSDDKFRKRRDNLNKRKFGPHPGRKLTVEQAREIMESIDGNKSVAARYGVTARVVQRIKRGDHYRDAFAEPSPIAPALRRNV